MPDGRVTGVAVILVADGRFDHESGGLGQALRAHGAAVWATSLESAVLLAKRQRPAIAIVHTGLGAAPDRKPGGVIVAAELARLLPGVSILLTGAVRDLAGWSLLHELGASARFVPDDAPGWDCHRLLEALIDEASARRALSEVLDSVPVAGGGMLAPMRLGGFMAALERSLIGMAAQQATMRRDAATLLGLGEGGLRGRLRKLQMTVGVRGPPRSTRDRILVVGTGASTRAFVTALSEGDTAALLLTPGSLHAGAEARGGARAAVIEVDGVEAAVDAWALARVAPAIPIVLHARGSPAVCLVLRTLGGLPEPLSSCSLATCLPPVVERLLALGRASCTADRRCVSLGGAGEAPTVPPVIDLRDVISAVRRGLIDLAVEQQPTLDKAAELFGISVRALHRYRTGGRSRLPRR